MAQCPGRGRRTGSSPPRETLMTRYRVLYETDRKAVGTADSPEGLLEVVEKAGPGSYDIEEVNVESRPSGSVAQPWAKATNIQDVGVTIELHTGHSYSKKFLPPA